MRPFLQRLAKVAECFVHVYSNAGLPNAMGGYDDTPADMARDNRLFAEEGLINMLGGCCGSTPPHIKARRVFRGFVCLFCVCAALAGARCGVGRDDSLLSIIQRCDAKATEQAVVESLL